MNFVHPLVPLIMAVILGAGGLVPYIPLPDSRLLTQPTAPSSRDLLGPPDRPAVFQASDLLARLALYFIENGGQVGAAARYTIQGRDRTLYFMPDRVVFRLRGDRAARPPDHLLVLAFAGADPSVRPEGVDRAEMTVNYFIGRPDQWRTGLPAYTRVRYRDLWPGIDLVWQGERGRLKQLFRIEPGTDPRQIALIYRGAHAVTVEPDGSLAVTTPAGSFRDAPPTAWQEDNGIVTDVPAAYRVTPAGADAWAYGFELGAYDPARPLLLDPELFLYAGYVGGSADDEAAAVAVDAAGNTYITGETMSDETSFPAGSGYGAAAGTGSHL